MAARPIVQLAPKAEQPRDIVARWGQVVRTWLNDVMEAQVQPPMRCELGESRRIGPLGIEDGNDVGDPGGAMLVEFGCYPKRDEAHAHPTYFNRVR